MSQEQQKYNISQSHLNLHDEKSDEYNTNTNEDILGPSLSINFDPQSIHQHQRCASLSSLNTNPTYRRSSKFKIEFERRNIKRAKSTNPYSSFTTKSIPHNNIQFTFKNDIINPLNTNHTNTLEEFEDNDVKTPHMNDISLELPANSPNTSMLTPSKIQSKIIRPFAAKIDAKINNTSDSNKTQFSFTQMDENVNTQNNSYNIHITSPKDVINEINDTKSKEKRKQQIKKRMVNSKKKLVKNESKYERRQRERLEAIATKKKTHININNKRIDSKKTTKLNSNKKQERISKKKKIEENKKKYDHKQRQKLQSFKAKKTKHLKIKTDNKRRKQKSKSAQQVLNDIKRKKIASNNSAHIAKDKKRKSDKLRKLSAAEKRKQKLQKAKNQVKRIENKLKVEKNEEIKRRNKRKRDKEKAYKERTTEALQSAELKKIELSSAVWSALKQLRPVQRKKIETEIKRQLKDEKDLMIKMKDELENARLKTEREQILIKEKFEREKNLNRKEKEALMLERKQLKIQNEEIYALRKAELNKKRMMDAELNKNILEMRDTKKRLDKTQLMTQQKRVQLMQQSEQVNMKLKNMNNQGVKQNEKRELSENTKQLMGRFKDLVCKDMERLRREKQQIMNKKHEINMKQAEIHNKEEVLDKKKREFEREKRRLSQDLSSHAAKLVAELTGYDTIDQQLQFNQVILKILNHSIDRDKSNNHSLILEKINREKHDLEQKYHQLKQTTKRLEKELQHTKSIPIKASIPASVPKITVPSAPIPKINKNSQVNSINIAPAPTPSNIAAPPLNVAPAPLNMAAPPVNVFAAVPVALPAPPALNGSVPKIPPPLKATGGLNGLVMFPNIPKVKEIEFMGKAPPKDIKMRGVKWNPLKGKTLNASIFNDMKINYDDAQLEFDILDRLWCKPKKEKSKDKKIKKIKEKRNKRCKIEFLSEMDDDGKKGKAVNMIISAPAMKKSAEEYRDIILSMEFDEKDEKRAEELVTAIYKIVPTEKHVIRFNDYFKSQKYKLIHVKYFGIGERLWYYCRNIPLVSLRCKMWKFKLQFDELCDDQYKHINLLKDTNDVIYGNEDMFKVFELVIVIGNYLNYGHKKNGAAKGIRLDIFDKFRDLKANKQSDIDKYTLLMYLVDMINKKYPNLANWVNIFNNCNACGKIKSDELESDVKSICSQVKELKINLQKMDEQRIKFEKDEKRKVAKRNRKKEKESKELKDESNEEETWEEPMRPNDVYSKVMNEFLQKAQYDSVKLMQMFEDTMRKCNKLVIGMGERLTEKYTLSHFWSALDDIKTYWVEAQKLLKTEQKKAETKKKLVHKLQRRTSKDILKKKGIIKSENDIRKEREKKLRCGQIAIENIIKKKVAFEIQLYSGMGRMTRHKSIGLAELQYKCQHCGIIKKDIANINNSIYNEYCHECYITPNNIINKSLQWLPLNNKSNNCNFDHKGGCLIIYTESDKKRDESNEYEKRKQFLNSKRHKTADSLSTNLSFASLNDINYNNMDNLLVIDNLNNEKYEKYAVDKIIENLKNGKKIKNNFLHSDSESSENDQQFQSSIIYADKMKEKKYTKHKKKKVGNKYNSARKLYSKKNLFTRNPKKKSKKKRLSKTNKSNIRLSLESI